MRGFASLVVIVLAEGAACQMGKSMCLIRAAQLDMPTGSHLLLPDAVPGPHCCLLLPSALAGRPLCQVGCWLVLKR